MIDDAETVKAARDALAKLKKPMTKAEQVKAWLTTLDADIRDAVKRGALLKDIAVAVSTADIKVTVAELRDYLKPKPKAAGTAAPATSAPARATPKK